MSGQAMVWCALNVDEAVVYLRAPNPQAVLKRLEDAGVVINLSSEHPTYTLSESERDAIRRGLVDFSMACRKALGTEPKVLTDRVDMNIAGRTAAEQRRWNRFLETKRLLDAEDSAATLGERGGPLRMVDDAKPRSGENAGDAIARRFREHTARAKLDGRPPLAFSEFLEHDRVLTEPLYLLHEAERAAPEMEAAERQRRALSEIDAKARPLMKAGLSLSGARAKILADNPALSSRYRCASLGLAEPPDTED